MHSYSVLLVLMLVVAGRSVAEISKYCKNGACKEDTENKYKSGDQDTPHTKHVEDVTYGHQENNVRERQRVQKIAVKPYSYDAPVIEGDTIYHGKETTNGAGVENSDNLGTDERDTGAAKDQYEFPPLVRLDPGELDDIKKVELEPGVMYKRITRALDPPVFEILNFLSPDECDYIINKANDVGLEPSSMFGKDVQGPRKPGALPSDIPRVSRNAWVWPNHTSMSFRERLTARLTKLTGMPAGIILRAEPLQVVNYEPGGHYHAHMDSVETQHLPCCFQIDCGAKEKTSTWDECCRLCRFMTVMYFLNNVEEGGQTAFPLADMPDKLYKEKLVNIRQQKWYNLSEYCHNSSLLITPRRGTAIMWYTHFLDHKGYLGSLDKRSHHGGCDVIRGTKWIANTWISAPTYENRFLPSQFYRK